MDRWAAEQKRAELLEQRRQEETALLAGKDFARNREAQALEPKLILRPDGAYLNMPMVRRLVGSAMQGGSERGHVTLPTYDVDGIACVRAGDLEAALDSGRFGLSLIGRLEVLQIMASADLDNWTAMLLGFRQPSKGWRADESLNLGRYLEADGEVGGRIDQAIRERYRGELTSILPCEVGLDHRHNTVVWVRALRAASGPSAPAVGMGEIDFGGTDDGEVA